MIGEITKEKNGGNVSNYQPPKEVIDLTKVARDEYNVGYQILHQPYSELNGYSVIDRMNKDQRTFNSYVDESVDNPAEAWKWRGTRSIARNRAMAMHAHLTSVLAVPMAFAQNDRQEEDREVSQVARDILEWMAVNSNYRQSYVLATMGALVNPAVFLGAEYCEAYQKVKVMNDEGYETKEILDEVFSGFQATVYSADQVLITNAYEQDMQKQRAILKRRYIDFHEAAAKHGENPNWQYVQKGIKTLYSEEDGLFYDIFDDEAHSELVEEVYYLNRRRDEEVCFVNGIYLGNENVEWNPIRHRDNRDAPSYNVVPFGYERINEHFFYYKSMINRVGWDAALIDAMYENTMNRELLDLYPPLAISGAENLDAKAIAPGSLFTSPSPEFEAKPVIPPNRVSGYQAMREIEKSIGEASVSEVQTGALPEASQKAFTVARAEQNARTILRGSFRTIADSVARYGQLMLDIAVQHLTTAQLDEITGSTTYRSFFLSDQKVGGKTVGKHILFDEALVGRTMGEEQKYTKAMELLERSGYPRAKNHLYLINPHLWSKLRYYSRIEPDVMLEKNEAFERQMAERMYALLRQDPLVSPESLVRDLLNSNYRGGADERMAKQDDVERIMGRAEASMTPDGQQESKGNMAKVEQAMTGSI